MSVFKAETVRKIFAEKPEYRVIQTFIETGTFKARTIRNMRGLFKKLHTIDLSEEIHADAVARYGHMAIKFHCGDSAVLLPQIAERVGGPIFFYLDAHGFDRPKVAAGFPLWEELKYIRDRGQADIVVIDDVHNFGTKNDRPQFESGWADVTSRAIIDYLGRERHNGKMKLNNSLIVFRKGKG